MRRIAVLRANQLGDLVMTLPALAALRAAYPSAELVLLGAPLHAELLAGCATAEEVGAYMREDAAVLAGDLSLSELIGLLDRAAVLANDTGPRHLAEAVGTPTATADPASTGSRG